MNREQARRIVEELIVLRQTLNPSEAAALRFLLSAEAEAAEEQQTNRQAWHALTTATAWLPLGAREGDEIAVALNIIDGIETFKRSTEAEAAKLRGLLRDVRRRVVSGERCIDIIDAAIRADAAQPAQEPRFAHPMREHVDGVIGAPEASERVAGALVRTAPQRIDSEEAPMELRPCFRCGEYNINGCARDNCPTRIV